MATENDIPEIRLDSAGLYREEVFTDRRMGTIRKLIPILADGSEDPSRESLWEGSTSLLTPAGALPLSFEVQAATLSEALERFPAAARESIERTLEELRELRREQASSIVVPGRGRGGMGDLGGAGGHGGAPGGGIKLR